MSNILIVYSTTDGHTKKICSHLKSIIEREDNQVTLMSVEDENKIDLNMFDKVVLGASIRYGKHSPKVYSFIKKHSPALDARPNAFFSVNLVARKEGRNTPETNPYLKKFLKEISWRPKNVYVFAGKLDYKLYNFWDRMIIRMIMMITKGPTDPEAEVEYTNWKQVEEFGQLVCKM